MSPLTPPPNEQTGSRTKRGSNDYSCSENGKNIDDDETTELLLRDQNALIEKLFRYDQKLQQAETSIDNLCKNLQHVTDEAEKQVKHLQQQIHQYTTFQQGTIQTYNHHLANACQLVTLLDTTDTLLLPSSTTTTTTQLTKKQSKPTKKQTTTTLETDHDNRHHNRDNDHTRTFQTTRAMARLRVLCALTRIGGAIPSFQLLTEHYDKDDDDDDNNVGEREQSSSVWQFVFLPHPTKCKEILDHDDDEDMFVMIQVRIQEEDTPNHAIRVCDTRPKCVGLEAYIKQNMEIDPVTIPLLLLLRKERMEPDSSFSSFSFSSLVHKVVGTMSVASMAELDNKSSQLREWVSSSSSSTTAAERAERASEHK